MIDLNGEKVGDAEVSSGVFDNRNNSHESDETLTTSDSENSNILFDKYLNVNNTRFIMIIIVVSMAMKL